MSERWFFFDEREKTTVAEALATLGTSAPNEARLAEESLGRLSRAASLVIDCASTVRNDATSETLIDLLCRVPEWDLDLHVPTKALVGNAYLVMKINFFKGLGYALEGSAPAPELIERVHAEAGQSIYTKLAEELFVAIVTDPAGRRNVKLHAARELFHIWEHRLDAEIDDFAPVLESVWLARDRVRPVVGTLQGTSEFLRLLGTTSDHRFFDHFVDGDVPQEEIDAFEEFLFGIAYESIGKIREHLATGARGAVSALDAATIAGRNADSWAPTWGGPQAIYSSYKKRKVKAHYRTLAQAPGPKKTAEEYVMIAFLDRAD
ncbi:MAG TPA: hypothetical protein VGH28_22070 [Polyangiaceae bacterium]|jgi:hypothetical protein